MSQPGPLTRPAAAQEEHRAAVMIRAQIEMRMHFFMSMLIVPVQVLFELQEHFLH
jgi:hypothetical protein